MEGKLCDVIDGKMEKSDPKVFWRSPPQCIYSMVLGFFTHGNLLSMVFIYGFFSHSHFYGFLPFLGESGDKSQ